MEKEKGPFAKIFNAEGTRELTIEEIREEFMRVSPRWRPTDEEMRSRLTGYHCNCRPGEGELLILRPESGEKPFEKAYVQCRICGGYSHL